MFGTDLNFEPTTTTFYVHTSATNRETRVYKPRRPRRAQLLAALPKRYGGRA